MSPFSAPFFWGTQKRGLLLPKRVAALWEGTQWRKGGTGKAEDAKLRDGIGPKQCLGKCEAEKGWLAELRRILEARCRRGVRVKGDLKTRAFSSCWC